MSASPEVASLEAKATDRDGVQVPAALRGQDKGEAPGGSALSVADVVVTEYEKLLAAIPTMAKHMGKLQSDTEAMAMGELRDVAPASFHFFVYPVSCYRVVGR